MNVWTFLAVLSLCGLIGFATWVTNEPGCLWAILLIAGVIAAARKRQIP